MKRISLMILLAAIALCGMAQTIGEAFYIYRNDGQFNAFFRDEVQAIEYSYYDADSVKYEEIVTQVVITADSVYKIPLAAIDSVGFVHPETVYRDDAKQIKGDLYDYLINVDDMMLTFSASTPSNILPIIGDKLVEVDETDKLPLGFLGQVESVTNNGSNIEVVCKKIELEEVVKTFYRTVGIVSDDTNNAPMLTRRAVKMDYSPIRFNIGKLHFPMSYAEVASEKDILGFKGKISGKLNNDLYITPKIIGKVTRAIDDILVLSYYNVQINTDVDFEDDFEFACEWTGSLKKPWVDDDFPTPVWGYPIYFAVGPVTDLSGELAMGVHLTGTLRVNTDITYYPATSLLTPILPAANLINRVSIIPSLENASASLPYFTASGSFKFGVFCRFGLPFPNHKVAWVGGEVETGAKIEANAKFDFDKLREADKSTLLYEEAVETMTLDVMPYWSLKFVASALDDKYKFEVGRDNSFWGFKFLEGSIIPKFSGTTFTRAGGNTAYASVDITNDCPFACKVGFSLFNENGTKVETKYCDKEYHTRMDFSAYGITFDNLDPTKKYKVYPCLNYGGYDILGLPSAELIPVTVEVTKMHISNIQYAKNAFTNDGEAYDFCYNAEITTELVNAEGVVDWGYVYEDPKRNIKRISLMGNQSPYTDTNYAFYRNEPKSEACLYGYIKYVGDDNYYYGEKKNYPLIYDKQPEATTLEPTYVDETSAKVKCGFKEVAPWGGTCGIEYWEDTNDKDSKKIYFETAQEEIEVTLNDLKPGTIYYYQAFIKVDDEFIMAEEVKHFTTQSAMANLCPDDKHPHLIDLGLQSGTKWACCNVGAASPADYGGYFAWGETQAREEFTWGADYALYNTTTFDFDYIGEDIAGTKYDAATANWGDSWQMPNRAQCKELFLSCSYMVKNMNGIDGWEFTGPNGGKIFIPFAGTIEYTRNDWSGYRGFYWTSNNYDSNSVMASGFIFDKDWGWNVSGVEGQNDGHIRCYGETIRPVQPGITVTTGDATEITVSSATLHGSCSKGISTAGFSVKKEGESEYVQYNAYPDEEGNFSATIEDLDIETKYVYYAFVQTDEKTYKGEELSLSTKPLCPDDKHPHLIDLGLPSGTKWACCNVGASRPEENGNYYAWGDGSEKTEFYMDTYLYQEYSEIAKTVICSYIGEDISGTEYDIALQKWGNPWCMPSKDDYEELMANCKIYEVTYKGEKGTLFVAPNGKNVFMKPQGYRDCCDLHGTEQGVYWTSTYSHVDSVTAEWAKYINAYAFQFMGDYVYINGEHSRVYGYAVRPIAK